MKVRQMTNNSSGRGIPNQMIISATENGQDIEYFQSYESIIGRKTYGADRRIELDRRFYNYSKTTARYRNQWLGMDTKAVEAAIKDGSIVLTDLNKDN